MSGDEAENLKVSKLGDDGFQGLDEDRPERPDAGVSLPELRLHKWPDDEGGTVRWHAAKALRQPLVDVEHKGVVLHGGDGPVVERYGVLPEGREILIAQAQE